MTAICKTIDIHGGLGRLLDYGSNELKTSLINQDLQNALDYAQNPLKTILELDDGDRSLLVTGVLCSPETAQEEFSFAKEKYQEIHGQEFPAKVTYTDKKTHKKRTIYKEPLSAVHLIQSFAETDLDPLVVHRIGIELCERMGWQAVVDTHMNTGHCHNHIIINAYLPDGEKKVSMKSKTRNEIRSVSDEIQLEYGIELRLPTPDQQLEKSKHSLNYREWAMKRNSLSWKDQIRSDMLAARHVSETREDFIAVMQGFGYAMERQTENSILWWNKRHTKKIWDHTLGDEYRLDRLMENEDIKQDYVPEQQKQNIRHHAKYISISRYSWNGRRRSDIELLIRRAISIVQHIRGFYERSDLGINYNADQKMSCLNEALQTVETRHIESEDHLKQLLHDTGAALSHAKSELLSLNFQKTYYDELARIVSEYEQAKAAFASVRHWAIPHTDLFQYSYSSMDVQQNRADLSPASPTQKRELFLTLQKHPAYRLQYVQKGYSNISSIDAQSVIRFFQGKEEKPDILISVSDAAPPGWIPYENYPEAPSAQNGANQVQRERFEKTISTESPGKQAILIQLRNRTNALLSLGYDPAHLDDIKSEIIRFQSALSSLTHERQSLAAEYKSLIRVRQMTRNAKSDPYLYGSMLTDHETSPPHEAKSPSPHHSLHPRPRPQPDRTSGLSTPHRSYDLHHTTDIPHEDDIPF